VSIIGQTFLRPPKPVTLPSRLAGFEDCSRPMSRHAHPTAQSLGTKWLLLEQDLRLGRSIVLALGPLSLCSLSLAPPVQLLHCSTSVKYADLLKTDHHKRVSVPSIPYYKVKVPKCLKIMPRLSPLLSSIVAAHFSSVEQAPERLFASAEN